MRPAQSLWRRLRKAEITHLSLPHEPRHRSHRILDGRFGVDPVQIIEIDAIDLQALQARLAGRSNMIGAPIDADEPPVWRAHAAAFCGKHQKVAPVENRAADKLLVPAQAVDIGGIEKIDATLDGAMNGGNRLLLIPRAVEVAHRHAAKAKRRDFEA